MAEALVESVADPLIQLVIRKASEQASRLRHFNKHLDQLSQKLKFMKGYLKDAELKSRNDERVKVLLAEIMNVVWKAEDIIEECATSTVPSILWGVSTSLRFRRRMGKRIQDVEDRVTSISYNLSQLQVLFKLIVPTSISQLQYEGDMRRRYSVPLDDEPVGMQGKIEEMKKLLEEPTNRVIAVLGMGGLGKTRLLQHVFEEIKKSEVRYDNYFWLSVSQNYSISELQCDVGACIGLENLRNISSHSAGERIYRHLQGTRCLIVLDDLWEDAWNADSEGSLMMRIGLPRGEYSHSRVIISTRSKEICTKMRALVYKMHPLSEEESWVLFCRSSFPRDNQPPEHLQQLAREVAKKCGGSPLAIKTIGAAMAIFKTEQEWKFKLDQLRSRGIEEEQVISTLRLSFDFLPSKLKYCYLYLSLFPKGEDISFEYLIYVWIAEGLIPNQEVGESHLSDLLDRCMIEPGRRNIELGKVESCKIHDLLRDVCVGKWKDYTCFYLETEDFTEQLSKLSWRRISLAKNEIKFIPENARCTSILRTLWLCSYNLKNIPPAFFAEARVLCVLDLSNSDITTLPESVRNMKLLKVLNLKNTLIMEVPACIRGLKNSLQFLDISKPDMITSLSPIVIPEWIGELRCLRHLSLHSYAAGSESKCIRSIDESLAQLTELQTLRVGTIDIDLSQVKEGIDGVGVLKLRRLQGLDIMLRSRTALIDFTQLPSKALQRLTVRGESSYRTGIHEIEVKGFHFLTRLFELECEKCWVNDDVELSLSLEVIKIDLKSTESYSDNKFLRMLQALQKVPNLRVLELRSCTLRQFLGCFGSSCFPKLERLTISEFFRLYELPMLEDGALKCLKELKVSDCIRLKKIPDGLERLPNLEALRVINCGEMGERLKENNEDWMKMKAFNENFDIISS